MAWERWLARLAHGVERRVDEVRDRVWPRHARHVVTYRGFAGTHEAWISGRVLASAEQPPPRADHTWWQNLLSSVRHLESDEVPGARVRIRGAGVEHEAVTDDEGFFRAWVPLATPAPDALWTQMDVEVLDRLPPGSNVVRATASILTPPASAEFGVISDLDDTVLRTDATRLVSMLRRTLLENALTRLPFEGVSSFYRALHLGTSRTPHNPVFYVSSSPWNLYPLLTLFLEHHGIPAGPLMLRDWGISERSVLPRAHGEHKLGAIRQILDAYPALPFILIGDSGQEDPEIYSRIVREQGARIRAVYIRNVSAAERASSIGRLAEEVRQAGSELLLTDDTLGSARHAADRGWIAPAAVDEVDAAVRKSAARPG